MKPWWAQTRVELLMSLRQGEQLLVALGIPILLLVFLTQVELLPAGTGRRIGTLLQFERQVRTLQHHRLHGTSSQTCRHAATPDFKGPVRAGE